MSAVAVVAFFALVVLPRTSVPLLDGDVWWHLRAGETVLDTGRVPTVDSWTIVGEGMRWISQDWLTNAAMAGVLRIGGSLGMTLLSLLFAGLVVVAFALLWLAIGRRSSRVGWLARLGWLTLGLIVAGPIAGVRVQTVDLLMTALAAFVLWSYLADRRARWLVGAPAPQRRVGQPPCRLAAAHGTHRWRRRRARRSTAWLHVEPGARRCSGARSGGSRSPAWRRSWPWH